jgi:hypothetical protein
LTEFSNQNPSLMATSIVNEAASDAWESQTLQVPEAGPSADEDEFSYFEYKLFRPRRFEFPQIDSTKERFSGLAHSIEVDPDLPPYKNTLSADSPDEYQAIIDIVSLQREHKQADKQIRDLRRALTFLRAEQEEASSHRGQRIAQGNLKLLTLPNLT